jgi:transposase-like protein
MPKRPHTEKAQKANYILRMARMLYAIEYLGRYCNTCKTDGFEIPWSMNFHHKNESEKLYDVKNKLYGTNLHIHKSEIDKCILLCANCHATFHATNKKYEEMKVEILDKLDEIKKQGKRCRLVSIPLSDNEKQNIVNLINDGYGMTDVSKITNIAYERIKYIKNTFGLSPNRGIRVPGSTILKCLNQKHSIRSIAKKIGINRETVRHWILENISYDIINTVKVFRYNNNYSSLAIQAKT